LRFVTTTTTTTRGHLLPSSCATRNLLGYIYPLLSFCLLQTARSSGEAEHLGDTSGYFFFAYHFRMALDVSRQTGGAGGGGGSKHHIPFSWGVKGFRGQAGFMSWTLQYIVDMGTQ
jgi:hypothetical protein